jgi:hypothetical protein
MVYFKEEWSDRTVERPLTYTLQSNGDGSTTLIPAEGSIISTGTPITATKLNHLETQYDEGTEYTDLMLRNAAWGWSPDIFMETCRLIFYTNGNSIFAETGWTFSQAFTETPMIIPSYIDTTVPYSDTIYYPFIYQVTKTGFRVRIKSTGNLGTVGSPANMFMKYLAIGVR